MFFMQIHYADDDALASCGVRMRDEAGDLVKLALSLFILARFCPTHHRQRLRIGNKLDV